MKVFFINQQYQNLEKKNFYVLMYEVPVFLNGTTIKNQKINKKKI